MKKYPLSMQTLQLLQNATNAGIKVRVVLEQCTVKRLVFNKKYFAYRVYSTNGKITSFIDLNYGTCFEHSELAIQAFLKGTLTGLFLQSVIKDSIEREAQHIKKMQDIDIAIDTIGGRTCKVVGEEYNIPILKVMNRVRSAIKQCKEQDGDLEEYKQSNSIESLRSNADFWVHRLTALKQDTISKKDDI